MAITQKVNEIVEALLLPLEFELYDIELNGGILKVTINSKSGVSIDELVDINRNISAELDKQDLIQNKYTLEVSSPGLERKLRKKDHYLGAINERISVKLGSHVEGERRYEGMLVNINKEILTIEDDKGTKDEINLNDVTSAKTVFKWEKNPKPGSRKTHLGVS
tara:strand:+ start:119 stop:610 length:492 start_codon:yes stop_codon:yes gene_type:complete